MEREIPVGIVVATRELEFVYKDGRKEAVLVSIGNPVQNKEPECWYCPYLIEASTFKAQHHTVGIDAVQALDLALGVISAELSHLSRRYAGAFIFLGEPGHEFRSP